MQKVGVITLVGYFNYGNRLQNYATQEAIKELGLEVQTVVCRSEIEPVREPLNRIFKTKTANFMSMTNPERRSAIKAKVTNRLNRRLMYERCEGFRLFTQANICQADFSISDGHFPDGLAESYDAFITGSDQVWNPSFAGTPIHFLAFAPTQKRIAYAASFGVSKLPEDCIETYRKCISEIPHLSVREQAGADIIKELTGQDVLVLVDPTLMLSKERWLLISEPATHKPSRPYLLAYFLGPVDRHIKNRIRNIATRADLEVAQLASLDDKRRYSADPAEFIDYVSSADVVFTDSFHGAVFSILFEKPFVVYDRKGTRLPMHSRIDTLLETFKLQSRRWQDIQDKNEDHIFDINFAHIQPILEAERKKAVAYLKTALSSALNS